MRTYLFSVRRNGSSDELESVNAAIVALLDDEKEELQDGVCDVSEKEKDQEDFQCVVAEIQFMVDTLFFAADDTIATIFGESLAEALSKMVAEEGFSNEDFSAELKEGFLSVPGGGRRAFIPTRIVSVFSL